MPSPFDITAPSNTVVLDNKREGVAVFTVKNLTRRRVHATGRVTIEAPNSESWASFLPPAGATTDHPEARDIPIDGSTTFEIKLAVPADVPPGSYKIKLTVADEINPDDNFTESPEAQFTVPEPPKPQENKLPPWLIPAIIIGVLVIVVIIGGVVIATRPQPTATFTPIPPTDTPTATSTFTPSPVPTSTPTPTATKVPNPFTGSWEPVGSSNPIEALGIVDAGNNFMTITYTGRCPPDRAICFSTSQTFTFTNVPFTPTQLAAGGSVLQMVIVPSSNGQLTVTVNSSGIVSLQQFQRKSRLSLPDLGSPRMIVTNFFIPFEAVATATPGGG